MTIELLGHAGHLGSSVTNKNDIKPILDYPVVKYAEVQQRFISASIIYKKYVPHPSQYVFH